MSDTPEVTLAKESLDELRAAIKATPGGEQVLARMEMNIDNLIAPIIKQGPTGTVYLALLAAIVLVRIDEIPR